MNKIEVQRRFGEAVRRWRHQRSISQDELAGRAGLHRTYISDLERGTRNVSLRSIEKLADALEVSIVTLFSQPEDQPAVESQATSELSAPRPALNNTNVSPRQARL
jgi:transcriptional regulator with XRE-family HTH domain